MNEAERRALWLRLIREDLPQAAAARPDWPVRLDHCFARIIVDAICDRPWREVIPAPAWRRMNMDQLERAVALAQAIQEGRADIFALNDRSLALRDKARSRSSPPTGET